MCIVSVVCYIQMCICAIVSKYLLFFSPRNTYIVWLYGIETDMGMYVCMCICLCVYVLFENQNRISIWFGQSGINPIVKIDSNESINQSGAIIPMYKNIIYIA